VTSDGKLPVDFAVGVVCCHFLLGNENVTLFVGLVGFGIYKVVMFGDVLWCPFAHTGHGIYRGVKGIWKFLKWCRNFIVTAWNALVSTEWKVIPNDAP
jgi:hypothetical protein